MKFKIQCLKIRFHWRTAMLIHWRLSVATFVLGQQSWGLEASIAWKWTSWSFIGKLRPPSLGLCCSKCGLWANSIGLPWEAVRNVESCLYLRPTDSESPDPRWVLLSLQFEKRWCTWECVSLIYNLWIFKQIVWTLFILLTWGHRYEWQVC